MQTSRLAGLPVTYRFPIVVSDPGVQHHDVAVHVPNVGVALVRHREAALTQKDRFRRIKREGADERIRIEPGKLCDQSVCHLIVGIETQQPVGSDFRLCVA